MADPFNFSYIKPTFEDIFKNPAAAAAKATAPVQKVAEQKKPATKPAANDQYSIYANL